MINFSKMPQNNTVIKILSLIVAFILWMYVMGEQNPSITRVYTVPIDQSSLANGLIILDEPETVRVKIRGSRTVLSDITSKDIRAFINLQGVQHGNYSKNIQVTLPADTQLVEVSPDSVNLNIDLLEQRDINIDVKVVGDIPKGLQLESTTLSPNRAMVYGPESSVGKIDRVEAIFNIDKDSIKEETKVRVQVVAVDSEHNIIDKITIEPTNVFLTAIFTEKIATLSVPVRVFLQGTIPKGFKVVNVTTKPEKIEITGAENILKEIAEINIDDVNVDGLTQTIVKQVIVKLPDGVSSTTNEIEISINVAPQ